MMEKLKYSKRLGDVASIIIIDNEVVKYRGRDLDKVSSEDIELAKLNCNNILIQDGRKINIYCRQREIQLYKYEVVLLKDMGISNDSLVNINFNCNGVECNALWFMER